MLSARNIYIGAMVLGGLALAVASLRWPVVHEGPVPPLMWLLCISLVFDLAIMGRAAAGRLEPLQMNGRVAGFVAGALVYFGLRLALAG